MMIRNPQATPVRSTTDGRLANAFQIVMKTLNGETVADMSFQALDIKTIWVCGYTEWFLTTPCTANCGGGFRTRVRRMLHANPEGYDRRLLKNCHESLEEHETCNTQECDVDCQLSEWTPWANGECSRSCGGGTMVERRNVVMGPKGHGLICPPWSSDARVRVVPCNMNPCNASCIPSELEDEYKPFVKDFLVFKDVPTTDGEEDAQSDALDQSEAPSESKAVPKEAQGNSGEDTTDSNEQSSAQENSGTADKENNIGAVTEENEASNEDQPDVTQSLLSLRETPRTQLGLTKSSCSAPCGGGRRLVLIPSERKVSAGEDDKSCHLAFEEDCNNFPCKPLMMQPASPWEHPVAGQWFMLDISFVIEELAESFTIRAPPDFELAVTGNASECFLVEHSLPNLENCTIYPGQTSERTGPIMVMYFSNPLEPQNSYTLRQDWYHLRVWVHHPQNCTGGNTTDGRCLGLEGEREWTLAVKMTEPVPLWEIVKGSYEIFVDEKSAKDVFDAHAEKDESFTDEAEEVERVETVEGGHPTNVAEEEKTELSHAKNDAKQSAQEKEESSNSLLEEVHTSLRDRHHENVRQKDIRGHRTQTVHQRVHTKQRRV